jgi:hypothetical protein
MSLKVLHKELVRALRERENTDQQGVAKQGSDLTVRATDVVGTAANYPRLLGGEAASTGNTSDATLRRSCDTCHPNADAKDGDASNTNVSFDCVKFAFHGACLQPVYGSDLTKLVDPIEVRAEDGRKLRAAIAAAPAGEAPNDAVP